MPALRPSFSQAASKRRPIIQAIGPDAGHPLAEGRVVILAAAHVADELEHMAVAVGEIRHQPFAEQVAHFERQPQQHVAGALHPERGRGIENALDLGVVDGRE